MPLCVKVRALCARSASPSMAFHAIEKCSMLQRHAAGGLRSLP